MLQPKNKAWVLLDLNVDTSTPTGKMILTMMAAVADKLDVHPSGCEQRYCSVFEGWEICDDV